MFGLDEYAPPICRIIQCPSSTYYEMDVRSAGMGNALKRAVDAIDYSQSTRNR